MELVNKNNLLCKYSHKYFVVINPIISTSFSNSNSTTENSMESKNKYVSSVINELKEQIMIGNIIA